MTPTHSRPIVQEENSSETTPCPAITKTLGPLPRRLPGGGVGNRRAIRRRRNVRRSRRRRTRLRLTHRANHHSRHRHRYSRANSHRRCARNSQSAGGGPSSSAHTCRAAHFRHRHRSRRHRRRRSRIKLHARRLARAHNHARPEHAAILFFLLVLGALCAFLFFFLRRFVRAEIYLPLIHHDPRRVALRIQREIGPHDPRTSGRRANLKARV